MASNVRFSVTGEPFDIPLATTAPAPLIPVTAARRFTLMQESQGRMSRAVSGHQLNYLLQVPPNPPPAEGWPLLLFLHGYGECGDDLSQLKVHGPPRLTGQFGQLASCIIVSPQCPANSWWKAAALHALMTELLADRTDVDSTRLYITGLSMGGYGTWSFLSNYPDLFAAAAPVCGGSNPLRLSALRPPQCHGIENDFLPSELHRLRGLPIRTWHGSADQAVPVEETERVLRLMQDAGVNSIDYTLLQDAGHVDSWEIVYNDAAVWEWLFSQRRPQPAGSA